MSKRKNRKYKQLSFDTAMRNPERFRDMLAVIIKYENQILDDATLMKIVCDLFINKVIHSKRIQINDNTTQSDIENSVIDVNNKRNAEGGFPRGYQTRFYNYTKTMSEFGLIYAQYSQKLQFSKIVILWLENEIDAQNIFAASSMMYNRYSPHRRVLNDFNYFKFIINILFIKKELSYNEFIVSLFSKSDDVDSFLKITKKIKKLNSEDLFNYLSDIFEINTKYDTVMVDYPDVVLRMIRITGFVDIVYKGNIYLRLNENKIDLLKKLLAISFSLTSEAKDDALLFFNEINTQSNKYINIIMEEEESGLIDEKDYANKLKDIISTFSLTKEKVSNYLVLLACGRINKKSKTPEIFKYISNPLKLEFYISLLIFLIYGKNYYIKPNYKIDSQGIPISHAPAYKGDIEVYSPEKYWLIEVTLIKSKTQQLNNETTSVIRHLKQNKTSHNERYLSFIAPIIHEDTLNYFKVALILEGKENDIYGATYTINQFVDKIQNKDIFDDMKENFLLIKNEFKSKL